MDLTKLTIREAHEGLKAKKFSAEDLTKACLARAKERNPEINALIEITEEIALDQARKVDQEGIKTPLSGIPIAIKDIFCVKGYESAGSSKILEGFHPPYDATVVGKLREAGAVFVGRANCDEFACGASNEHSCYGPVKNPHDLKKVPGGSSGGSAAAVADGMCLAALGTDTGGSIRQPAAFCDCAGLKPTYGRVSRFGVMSMASSWDTIGPFGKTVDDVALMMQVMAGRDPRDLTTPDVPVPDYSVEVDIKGLKIGIPKEYEVSDEVMEKVRELEEKGAVLKEVSLPTTKYAVSAYYISMPAELSANLARYDGIRYGRKADGEDLEDFYKNARGEGFGDEIKRRIMIGTYVLSSGYYNAYYRKAQQVRTKIIEDFDRVFEEVDVICSAVSPFPPFGLGENLNDPLKMYLADALTIPASAAGLPSLALPCKGVGLQIIGPQFSEDLVLGVGRHF